MSTLHDLPRCWRCGEHHSAYTPCPMSSTVPIRHYTIPSAQPTEETRIERLERALRYGVMFDEIPNESPDLEHWQALAREALRPTEEERYRQHRERRGYVD